MTKRVISGRGALAVYGCLALGVSLGVARAEDAGTVQHDAASKGTVTGAGSGSAAGSPNTIVDPSNGGVAGTGMGKMTASPNGTAPGMGNSVKGPAGQGMINNSTDTGK